jgi:hypothetical protein
MQLNRFHCLTLTVTNRLPINRSREDCGVASPTITRKRLLNCRWDWDGLDSLPLRYTAEHYCNRAYLGSERRAFNAERTSSPRSFKIDRLLIPTELDQRNFTGVVELPRAHDANFRIKNNRGSISRRGCFWEQAKSGGELRAGSAVEYKCCCCLSWSSPRIRHWLRLQSSCSHH